ncbi:hypothetical protein HHK36_026768 [Tetracentron sinense]|uniref:Myb-like domain-containing protein n=1 Tax=Tetracentron sinense TaxID=13715 RepID=A0A834YLC1_TETSI|nr:hypothetical protein HHK36_026768 [Tetracentron sinense]
MFNGVPEQSQQFIASRTAPSPPLSPSLHLSLPLHVSSPTFSSFEPYPSHQTFQSHLLHQLHQQSSTYKDEEKEENRMIYRSSELERVRSMAESVDPWSNDEVLARLRTRSSMENWFPDPTWEHFSRKISELGVRRSAEKCKEKPEDEGRYCNSASYNKNCRFSSELEALYQGGNPQSLSTESEKMENPNGGRSDKMGLNLEENSGIEILENTSVENQYVVKKSNIKKRKRYHRFELLKAYCEEVVNKMMVQQEELFNKLLEDMKRRDEERVAREEAWKKQEMDRINKELGTRENELQAIACGRETTIIELLKKFTSSPSQNQSLEVRNIDLKAPNNSKPTSPSISLAQNPNLPCDQQNTQNKLEAPTSSTLALIPQNPDSNASPKNPKVPTSSALALAFQNPNPLTTLPAPPNPNLTSNNREACSKRWPRYEVEALISLRCNSHSSTVEDKEGMKASLWEKISQRMLELGYKRSARKCKEKWENITKYFRKTKDSNKKRSLDSKTCPYFHQLSSLYNQGTLMAPPKGPENHSS